MAGGNQSAATSTLSRLSFLDNGLKNIPAADEKISPIVKEIDALLATYRDALTKLMENRKQVDELITEMGEFGRGDHQGRRRHEGRSCVRPAAARIRI